MVRIHSVKTNSILTMSKVMSQLIPVVMAGGSGARLWPLSRVLYPKQFLTLQGQHTMLQNTLLRLSDF